MKLTRQQVLDLLSRAKAAGHLPSDGPTSLFVAQKRGKPVQLAVAVTDSKIVVRQSRLPFSRPFSSVPLPWNLLSWFETASLTRSLLTMRSCG